MRKHTRKGGNTKKTPGTAYIRVGGIGSAESFGSLRVRKHNLPACLPPKPLPLTNQQKLAAKALAYLGYFPDSKLKPYAARGRGIGRTATAKLAGEKAGCCERLIYYWMHLPEFLDQIEQYRREPVLIALEGLVENARKGDLRAQIEILERMSPELSKQYQLEMLRQAGESKRLEKLGKYIDNEVLTRPPAISIVYRTVQVQSYDKAKSEEETELERLEAELQHKISRGSIE